jgi:2'-5' RNA ligase
MTTRTFLAIELDDATRAFIAARMEPLRAALPGVRFVGGETWHLTLAFLGELDDAQLAAAEAAAHSAATGSAPFALHAADLGTFGGMNAPRVIWVGVGGDVAALRALQARVTEALAARGLHHDGRFSPHITLARLRQPLAPAEAAALRVALNVQTQGPDLPVTAISVMRSDLAPSGARYTCLARAALSA